MPCLIQELDEHMCSCPFLLGASKRVDFNNNFPEVIIKG